MKAILEIPEKELEFEFDNLTINHFRMIKQLPNDDNFMITDYTAIGEPITLITSNMPPPLKDEIIKIVEDYCSIK